jgi:hypothetical protein
MRSISFTWTPNQSGIQKLLIQNETINPIEQELIGLHSIINNNTHWAKLPHIPSNMQVIIDFINNTPKPPTTPSHWQWTNHPISFTTVIIASIIISLSGILIYYIRSKKNKITNVTIATPTLKPIQ